jgi:hypothetical protein
MSKRQHYIDETGNNYGYWTVLERDYEHEKHFHDKYEEREWFNLSDNEVAYLHMLFNMEFDGVAQIEKICLL